jgi:flavin reductase (DIM6/NTAB) family NADH-FMN oxidoreductase RutF
MVIDVKKLRETLGCFTTGVIIACARKKNFFSTTFFHENSFQKTKISQRFEDFWHNFLHTNSWGIAIANQFAKQKKLIKLTEWQNFLNNILLNKIKKLFADEFFGMTINSFTSVSLEPPLVLFCIDNKSANLSYFKKNKYFSFNILSQQQQELSSAFSTPKNSQKWFVAPYFFSKYGNPIFYDSLAFIECKRHKVIKIGDHHIIIGEIVDFGKINNSQPLLYFSGKYHKF